MPCVWGIDPGGTGCLVDIMYDRSEVLECRFSQGWQAVASFIKRRAYSRDVDGVYFENVHAMPGDGKSTMLTFGENIGIMKGMLYMADIEVGLEPFKLVVPDTWRRTFGLAGRKYTGTKSQQRSARKRDHLEVAKQIFPGVKLTQETCDAYLIAEHGWRVTFGKSTPEVKTELRAGTGILRSEIER